MIRSVRPLGMLAALLLFAAPAMAVPSFRMPTDSKIDLVRDLPNEDPFEHDGQYYDLGYLYSTERVNGADVARSGQGFVLYHDDRYIQLDAEKLSMVTLALGEDPTQGYIPPAPAAAGGRAGLGGESARDGDGAPVAGQPVPYRPSSRRGSGGVVGIFMAMLGFGFIVMLRLMMRSALRAVLSPLFPRRASASRFAAADPFEDRVATRLAQLEQGTPAASGYAPPPAAPAPRGFGRKGL